MSTYMHTYIPAHSQPHRTLRRVLGQPPVPLGAPTPATPATSGTSSPHSTASRKTPTPPATPTPSCPTSRTTHKIIESVVPDAALPGIYYSTTAAEQHSHLVLVGYLGETLPMPGSTCPRGQGPPLLAAGDSPRHRRLPLPADQGGQRLEQELAPLQFQLSFLPAGAARTAQSHNGLLLYYAQQSRHDAYQYPSKFSFGGRRHDHVVFPSQKVAVADSFPRRFGDGLLRLSTPPPATPLLGRFGLRAEPATPTRDGTATPLARRASKFTYVPDPLSPRPRRRQHGHRLLPLDAADLRGLDYGGPEIDTSLVRTW